MSIFDSIVSTFSGKKETPSVVKPTTISGLSFTTDISLEAFYKIYRDNQFVRSNVTNLMDTIWKYWFQLSDPQWDDSDKSTIRDIDSLFEDNLWRNKSKAFFKRIIRDYFVWWNVYIYKVSSLDEKGNRTWEITRLQILDPRFMTPITDKSGFILGYVQNIQGNITVFLPDEVSHLQYDSDIDDETVGLPLLRSLAIDLDLDQEAKDSNLAFFKNNQTPNSIIVLKDWISLEEWKAMSLVLKDTFKWGKNHHKAAMMAWVKEIVKVQDKIDDAQFLDMRKFTLDNTCALFWVPKSVLWYTEWVNYSNSERQSAEYIENTIVPTEEIISEFLTEIIQEIWFEDTTFIFIDDHLDRKQIKAKTTIELIGGWVMTIDEWRENLWLEPFKTKESQSLWMWTNKKIVGKEEKVASNAK